MSLFLILIDRVSQRLFPGINLAEQAIFVTMSTVLATLDVSPFDSKNKEELRLAQGILK